MVTQRSGEGEQEEKEKKSEMRLIHHLSRCQSGLGTAGHVVVASGGFQMATQPWVGGERYLVERGEKRVTSPERNHSQPVFSLHHNSFLERREREKGGVVVIVGSAFSPSSSAPAARSPLAVEYRVPHSTSTGWHPVNDTYN